MSSTEQLQDLYACLEQYPALLSTLSLTHIVHFIVYSAALKNDILLTQPAQHDPTIPPQHLSESISSFLCKVIGTPDRSDLVLECWEVFKHLIWSTEVADNLAASPYTMFQKYGHELGLSEYMLHIPDSSKYSPIL